MKRFSLILCVLLLSLTVALPASAAEAEAPVPDGSIGDSVEVPVSDTSAGDGADVPLSDSSTGDSADVPTSGSSTGDDAGGGPVSCSGADVMVDFVQHDMISVSSVLAFGSDGVDFHAVDSPSSVVDVIRGLFGTYTPRTQLVTTYYDGQTISSDEQVIPGLAGLDWEWLSGVVIFALMLFCLFRLLGGVLRHG